MFLRPHYFQILWCILFMFGMMIDSGPKFAAVPSPTPLPDLKVKVTDRFFMFKFYIEVFRTSSNDVLAQV